MRQCAAIAGGGIAAMGIALIALSVSNGSTHLYLLLVFPVLTGASAWFGAGVLLLVLGLAVFALGSASERMRIAPSSVESGTGPAEEGERSSAGGFVLIGPIPIFFGNAREFGDRYYWIALGAGVALFAGVIALLYFG